MRVTGVDHARLVVAAQSGDNRARDELIAEHLPLLYNIAGRALSGHADVDGLVQGWMRWPLYADQAPGR